ncbi:ABC transporter permease [Sphaerimonospora sp. CA-214678]|uniref:ABC transporter permease n=1 Tax=Sphaerimonospora sp. CA-214678 TaxID=3240029 RepID=UPI003D93BEF9
MLIRRLVVAFGTLAAISVLLFAGSEVMPGDAASSSLGIGATIEQIEQLRAEWGLDRPLPERYVEWASTALTGDLGTSLSARRPVTGLIAEPLAFTTLLVALSALITVLLSMVIGLAAGLRPGSRLDRVLLSTALVLVSTPQFVTAGLLVLLFATALGLLPAVSLVPLGGTPLDRPEILVLPVATLSIFATAWAATVVRATVIDANALPNVEAARLAGLPERRVIRRHLLPATVPACAQMFGWLVGGLFGGTAVVEQVFNYPGLSGVLISAVHNHDAPVLEGVGLLLAAIVLAALVLADLVGTLADPRLRAGTT